MSEVHDDALMDRYGSMDWYKLSSQQIVRRHGSTTYIVCPLHGHDCGHCAYFAEYGENAAILNFPCSVKGDGWLQGWIKLSMAELVKSTLESEERKFRALIDKFKHIPVGSMPPEKAVILWHSQGCPEEMAAEIATDYKEFYRLVERHKSTGGGGKGKPKIYA